LNWPDDFINKIICGDCLEVMKGMPDECVDLVMTDPPFCVDYGKRTKTLFRKQKQINLSYLWDKIVDLKKYRKFINDCLIEIFRIMKKNSSLYLWCGDNSLSYFRDFMEKIGFKYKATIIWHKTNPVPQFRKVNFLSSVEFLCFSQKGNPTFNFKFQKNMHNFIESSICMGKERVGIHEAQKPLSIIRHFIEISSNKNNLIADFFLGSGTTALACKQLKRNFIGIEINPDYCKIAEERLAQGVL